jgi:hypothetical protein
MTGFEAPGDGLEAHGNFANFLHAGAGRYRQVVHDQQIQVGAFRRRGAGDSWVDWDGGCVIDIKRQASSRLAVIDKAAEFNPRSPGGFCG